MNLCPHKSFGRDDFFCLLEYFSNVPLGNHQNPFEFGEDEIARADRDIPDLNWDLVSHHLPSPDGVLWTEIPVEDLKADVPKPFNVPEVAIQHDSCAPLGFGRVGGQFPKVSDRRTTIAGNEYGIGL